MTGGATGRHWLLVFAPGGRLFKGFVSGSADSIGAPLRMSRPIDSSGQLLKNADFRIDRNINFGLLRANLACWPSKSFGIVGRQADLTRQTFLPAPDQARLSPTTKSELTPHRRRMDKQKVSISSLRKKGDHRNGRLLNQPGPIANREHEFFGDDTDQ